MDRAELYDKMAGRKCKPADFEPYRGGNGRVDRCVQLFVEKKLPSGKLLLDVGGGIGDLGAALRERKIFEQTWLADISEENVGAARAKGNLSVVTDVDKDGLRDDFASGVFDVVTALDFIEHIVDPENFARECFRVLKPGGIVFVNTPNIQFWRHLESLLFRGVFPHTSGDRDVYHGGHLSFFCRNDLEEIFASAGFIGCRQFKDEEGFLNPPETFVKFLSPKNQNEYFDCCMRLGNPNLLFACEKSRST